MEMAKLRGIGKCESFEKHWPHLDPKKWPGREWKFLYCHPLIAAMLIFAVVSEIIIFIWIREVPFS